MQHDETAEQSICSHERLVYFFAKFCWKHRIEQAPNTEYDDNGKKRYYNWAEIFERRTGINLDTYARQAQSRSSSASEAIPKAIRTQVS